MDLSGQLHIRQHRFDALARSARHLQDVATLAANPFYHGLAMRLRALNAYHRGRFEPAKRWAVKAAEKIAGTLGESVHLSRCRLIMGLAAHRLKDPCGARQALAAADEQFGRASSSLSLVEARLGLSLVERSAGNTAAADKLMEAALALAAAKGYDALPHLSAADIRAACAPMPAAAQPETVRAAGRLLERLPADDTAIAKAPDGEELPTRSPAAEAAADAARPSVDIRTLGGFEVRRGSGEHIADDQWGGNRPKLMLKAIVVNGCREIPKEILMDAIWPDSDTAAALGRFKVTLHRLRNILEPHRDNRGRVSCIALKDNRVSLDSDRCRVDVNDFLAACDAMRQHKQADDDERCLAAGRRAAELYSGDFLPEEPYASWADMKRTALREQYTSVLMEMAALWERKNNLERAVRCCRRAIRTDPMDERAHQRLMTLLLGQGRRNEALKAYRDLERRLAEELDTVPDPETTRIYGNIAARKADG